MPTPLRIIYFGTPDFAVASLNVLVENGYDIAAVVTAPDKPAGRGQKLRQTAIKVYAEEKGLTVLQPQKLKSEEFIKQLKELNANLQIVVAFRMLPEVVWNMPEIGTFNLHGSLLPQYRGAAPINWAIINGETETGATTFFLKHEIDTGQVIFQEKISIGENDNAGKIHDQLMDVGAGLVLKTVQAIEVNDYPKTEQSELLIGEPKHAPKIFKDTCRIDWSKSINVIHNHIRGVSPYPAAWTELQIGDKTLVLKVFETKKEIAAHTKPIGEVVIEDKEFKVAVTGGYINIVSLQLAGKKRMLTKDFLLGFKADTNLVVI
ncbi:MAG: methionyl-tRNA formyltransferase [Flavobacteriales bacterium]|nr:methionyl-tRNA formyltransferase [Flavobacteriales bacterium]